MSQLVEVIGLACVAVAAFLVAPALGWLVAGVLLVLVAQGMDGAVTVATLRVLLARVPRRERSP